jgi:hypothetical protein
MVSLQTDIVRCAGCTIRCVGDRLLSVSVACYAGYRGEETPVRFRLGDRVIDVDAVLDRWLAPDHRYFKLKTADGTYVLRNDIASGEWELRLFERVSHD